MFGFGKRIKAGIIGLAMVVGLVAPQTALAADDLILVDYSESLPTLTALPQGWSLGGTNAGEYAAGTCKAETLAGQASGALLSTGFNFVGGGVLSQSIDAGAYRGKRVRLTAYVKTDKVQSGTGLWVKADGNGVTLREVDTRKAPILGTTNWRSYEVTVDVPLNADRLAFGLWLDGRGQAFINGLRLDVVVTQEFAHSQPSLSFGG